MKDRKITPTQCFGVLMIVWGVIIVEEDSTNFLRDPTIFDDKRQRMIDLAMARGMDLDVAEKLFVHSELTIAFANDMGFDNAE